MNGLIAADWTPHPGLFAVKYVYSNVKVEALDSQNGKFKVTNRFDYSTLDRMVSAIWSIEENGKEIANGKIKDFNIAPKESKEITLNLPKLKKQNGKEYFLNLSFHSKKAYSTLVEPGHELSFAQFKLGGNAVSLMTAKGSGDSVTSSEEGDSLIISGNDFTLSFDKKNGVLSSYSKDGKELIVAPIQYSFWRPFTDNDKLPIKFKKLKAIWRDAAKTQKLNSFDVKTANGITSVVASIAFPKVKSSVKTTYEIYPDGQVKVSSEYDLSKADKAGKPHRIGMIAEMPAQYDQFSWFGYGPGESYSDRNYKRVGTFNSTVDAEWMDYSRPQENGNKVGLRWMSLDSTEAKGLTFAAYGKHLSGSARFYTLETMEKSKYSFEMERSSNVIVNIDAIQMGIGGNDSWGSLPLNSYLLSNKKYTYSFIIK
jgi:beta-galactosidase